LTESLREIFKYYVLAKRRRRGREIDYKMQRYNKRRKGGEGSTGLLSILITSGGGGRAILCDDGMPKGMNELFIIKICPNAESRAIGDDDNKNNNNMPSPRRRNEKKYMSRHFNYNIILLYTAFRVLYKSEAKNYLI